MGKQRLIVLIVVLLNLCFLNFVFAEGSKEPRDIEDSQNIIYIPGGIDISKKYPLVVALSPSGDARSMVNTWNKVAERHKWIILSPKDFSNNAGPMDKVSANLADLLENIFLNYPVDKSKVIMTGFSGGGMQSHAFSFYYPKLVSAIVINTGMMEEYYIALKQMYPKNKIAVFLASPSDFRYSEMGRDKIFLEALNWKIKWIEFDGGHMLAPESAYEEAAQWLEKQVNVNN